jgi:hypothetical protein
MTRDPEMTGATIELKNVLALDAEKWGISAPTVLLVQRMELEVVEAHLLQLIGASFLLGTTTQRRRQLTGSSPNGALLAGAVLSLDAG